ncbi:MAG TPA: caspase family protein [Gemmatimonadaceae bacterium]|nr:caspase family protein [Gemmatimonadaceae bacterium]
MTSPANLVLRSGGGLSPESRFRDDAHAVIIGINSYQDDSIPDLRFARADAEAIYEVLVDPEFGAFRKENVALLVDADATERGIRSAIDKQLAEKAAPDDTVCLFYAGHGAPLIDRRGRSSDGFEKYLLPHDADARNLRATAISMDAIHDWFGWIHARKVVFFIDSCYSGAAGSKGDGSKSRSFAIPGVETRGAILTDDFLDEIAGEGRFVVTACAASEVSIETNELGHGLFTHHLVAGLKGGADPDATGFVMLDRLYSYVNDNVSRDAQRMGGNMTPRSSGSLQGFVYLTRYETAAKRRAREASTAAAAAFAKGDLQEAETLWQEAIGLEAEHADALAGLAAVREQRQAIELREQEARRIAQETLERRQGVLRGYADSKALTMLQFAEANDLLCANASELTDEDRSRLYFVVQLADERLRPSAYLNAIETWSKSGSRTAQGQPTTPPPKTETQGPPGNRQTAVGPKGKRSRGWRIGIASAVLLVVAAVVLRSTHVATADVEMHFVASELVFSVDSGVMLTRSLELQTIDLWNLSGARIPTEDGAGSTLVASSELQVRSADQSPSLGIASVQAESVAQVVVRPGGPSGSGVWLRATNLTERVALSALGKILVSHNIGAPPRSVNGGQITAMPRNKQLIASATFPDTLTSWFQSRVPVREVELVREELRDATSPVARSTSRLRSLTLRVDGYPYAVHPSGTLRLRLDATGQLLNLQVTARGVEADFVGRVSALSVSGATIMPRRLDWFTKGDGAKLLAGVALVLSILLGIRQWLFNRD